MTMEQQTPQPAIVVPEADDFLPLSAPTTSN